MLDDIIALLNPLDIVLWSVFFLVPPGRGSDIELISAEEFEQVFAKLYETSQRALFDIKSTEAQHYRPLSSATQDRSETIGRIPKPNISTLAAVHAIPRFWGDRRYRPRFAWH